MYFNIELMSFTRLFNNQIGFKIINVTWDTFNKAVVVLSD